MIDVNDLRKGVTFLIDNDLYKVLDYNFNKPGRGNATIRIKGRNLRTGATIERTFSSGERVQDAHLEYRNVQFLYSDGDIYYFMDTETYEQPGVQKEMLGDYVNYLKGGVEVKLTYYENKPLDAEMPTTVDLKVISANPAVKGDTATSVLKRIIVETGYALNVPAFVEEGNTIRIDTRTGEYVTRV